MNTKQKILKTFIRDKNNNPRGVALVIRSEKDEVSYGYSLLNDLRDKFDKKVGTRIALNRANQKSYDLPQVAERESMVLSAFESLQERSLKYWKDLSPEKIALKGHLTSYPWEE